MTLSEQRLAQSGSPISLLLESASGLVNLTSFGLPLFFIFKNALKIANFSKVGHFILTEHFHSFYKCFARMYLHTVKKRDVLGNTSPKDLVISQGQGFCTPRPETKGRGVQYSCPRKI